ncbi:right-handed parallel beta-helix repeat-containing protein [Clavibacter sp. VKM Ac-2542]|uniref:right-handed parallel beta-helix repeat-containing protein n=1 Tax=Clavibacter sp. VKM Ac-2542 TaxID=2783811 RepID=UPI00188B4256|nr:right-handed parallel beta-helix repeat-containing protein [Clavibacter sp. VKM Ac-2542]MBF4620714.1 right-handed parallel beta-helix repeat-containing protein [Clavibacter sp. VKM Ac-2542]
MNSTPRSLRSTVRPRHAIALAVAAGLVLPAALVAAGPAAAAGGQDLVAGAPVFSDAFTRSATGGWGTAPGAAAYAYDLPSAFRVNGTQGVVDLPRSGASVSVTLPAAVSADAEATMKVMLPRIPAAGGGVYAGLQQRVTGSSYYQTSVRVDPAGDARLSVVRVNGSTAAQTTVVGDVVVARGVLPGKVLTVQSRVSGSSAVAVDARVWPQGAAVPAWQAAAVDSSAARLVSGSATRVWSYLSSSSPTQAVAFDDVTVRPLTKAASPTPTPTPTPSPTPTAPAPTSSDPEQAVPRGDARPGTGSGAAAIGTTTYPAPADGVYVSPSGSDAGAGTKASPYASIQKAVDAAPSGRTIVVRAGTYRETVVMPAGKALTLQSYPGEAVWLDGSRTLTSWTASGSTRYAAGWDVTFDASPTYTRGAPDGTREGWAFVDPAFPMAAHPDQVWIGQAAQRQVASLAQVTAGTFFVDTAADRLYLGSDPGSQTVRASDRVSALAVRGDGSTVRGIGVRRYAPSVPDMGAVVVTGRNVTLADVAITDNATTGLSVQSTEVTLRAVTSARNGMLGIHANYADRLRASQLLVADDNTEGFNRAPVSGGFKITRSRDVDVVDSAFLRSAGNGLWFDESVYDATVAGNDVLANTGNGVVFELSAQLAFVDNVAAGNGAAGLWIDDSGHAQVWANTFSANKRDVDIAQGTRRAANLGEAGHDPRQQLPDPTVTWIVTDIQVADNVMQGSTGNALLAVEDHSHERSATQMGITTAGNVYQRDAASSPRWAIVWARGPGDPAVHDTVGAFTAATGNDRTSLDVVGQKALGSGWRLTTEIQAQQATVAVAVPAAVATLRGVATGARVIGAAAG